MPFIHLDYGPVISGVNLFQTSEETEKSSSAISKSIASPARMASATDI
jgi:hypothetical protein